MRLKLKQLALEDRLLEFDDWVTPTLGDIKDTEKFSAERSSIALAIETLGSRTNNFSKLDDTQPDRLAESIIEHLAGKSQVDQANLLLGVFSLFFLVTGKSDNNCKCQFPIYLRSTLRENGFPRIVKANGNSKLVSVEIPRVLDDEFLSKHICTLSIFPAAQLKLLSEYVGFLLDDPVYLKSFWAVGNTYFRMKELGLNNDSKRRTTNAWRVSTPQIWSTKLRHASDVGVNKLFSGDYMRKNLRAECYAETESRCEEMYISWLEDRVFTLEAKVEKFTSTNTASTQSTGYECGCECQCACHSR